jgi:RecB family exonuclease
VKQHWRSQRLAAPELERLEETCAPPPGVEERTRGVGTLKAQSRCAFQGFAFTRLALEPLRSPAPGFADHERGQLLHDALEHLWTELKDSAALAAHTAATLAPLLAESAASAISKARKRRDPGLRWREREQVRLEHLLAHWLEVERVRMPFVAERLEMRARTLSLAGLKFEVRIDRVDRLDDGSYVLIDYKTGAAVVDWQRDRPKNPQLPVYALALRKPLAAVAYGRVNAAGCGFVPETDRRGVFKPTGRVTSLEGAASLAALVPLWAQRIERIAAQFAAGRAVLDPLGGACSECRFQAVCRVDPTLIEYTDE